MIMLAAVDLIARAPDDISPRWATLVVIGFGLDRPGRGG